MRETQSGPGGEREMNGSGFAMLSGTDPASYATNSTPQSSILPRCRPLLQNAIAIQQAYLQDMKRPSTPTCDGAVFRIADMGSSSGPNCLVNMQFMLDALREHRKSSENAETQFFFCDLPSNDFNTLFQLQRERFPQLTQHRLGQGDVFGGAVAGSVYGRLFPASSLHLVFSSFCLHWLSQIPTSVLDPRAGEWNKGKIWVDAPHGNEAAGKAYAQQWHNDMRAFLEARSEEMVPGGLVFLVMVCRPNAFPPHQMQDESCLRNLELAWQQLTREGVIDQADLDTFNVPMYLPTMDEIACAISSTPSLRIHSVEAIKEDVGQSNYWTQWSHIPSEWALRVDNFYRSLLWNLTVSLVGDAKCEAIFGRFRELLKTSLESRSSWDPYWAHPWCSYAIVQVFKAEETF